MKSFYAVCFMGLSCSGLMAMEEWPNHAGKSRRAMNGVPEGGFGDEPLERILARQSKHHSDLKERSTRGRRDQKLSQRIIEPCKEKPDRCGVSPSSEELQGHRVVSSQTHIRSSHARTEAGCFAPGRHRRQSRKVVVVPRQSNASNVQ